MSIAAIGAGALGFLKTPAGKWLALIGGALLALYIAREQGIATGHEECQRAALEAALSFEQSQRVIAEDAAVAGAERAAELELTTGNWRPSSMKQGPLWRTPTLLAVALSMGLSACAGSTQTFAPAAVSLPAPPSCMAPVTVPARRSRGRSAPYRNQTRPSPHPGQFAARLLARLVSGHCRGLRGRR